MLEIRHFNKKIIFKKTVLFYILEGEIQRKRKLFLKKWIHL